MPPHVELAPGLDRTWTFCLRGGATGPDFSGFDGWSTDEARTLSYQIDLGLPFPGLLERHVVVTLYYKLEADVAPNPPAPTLSNVVESLREETMLPVNEVAAMIGVGRRQLYNILDGEGTSVETEQHILVVSQMVESLRRRLNQDRRRIRTSLLTPISEIEGKSLVQISGSRDPLLMREAVEYLLGIDGKNAVELNWRRTRPLGTTGETAGMLIQESIEHEE